MMGLTNIIGILFAVAISVNPSFFYADASNFNKPHSHTGKVEPFKPGDPKIKIDGKAKSILKSGKPYQVSSLSQFNGHSVLSICFKSHPCKMYTHYMNILS